MTNPSSIKDDEYREILASILKRFIRLVGTPTAVRVARRTPDLVLDDDGNVIDFDHNNPLVTITQLIDQYGVVFGETAVALSRQAVRPVGAPENVLREAGLAPPRETPIRLMLVDDAVLFRESLANFLQQQPDFTVVGQAGSMREALTRAEQLQPEMILMDFSLPDGTGLDATIAILSAQPEVKIVFLTVHEDDERLFGAIRAGAKGYLFKNAHTAELVRTLQGVMRGEAGLSRHLARRILEEFSRTPTPSPETPIEQVNLTLREIEIVQELARGGSNKEIAQKFVISENTVKNHVRNVLSKLQVHSRREIAKYARTSGLLEK